MNFDPVDALTLPQPRAFRWNRPSYLRPTRSLPWRRTWSAVSLHGRLLQTWLRSSLIVGRAPAR